jgi:membrane-bound lytic murein transglycosylase D
MRKIFIGILFILFSFNAIAQEVVIPEYINFADMELRLTDQVRKILKSEVEAIKRNPKYFQIKVDRANLYFPIIEKVLKEENFPDEFKYLALQESSLVSDAVSSSNAVGYWQFKKESAVEVGLRVDHIVDERIHIISSTRGAAKYLRKNNVPLNNWIYALLAYNLGPGGVKPKVEAKYIGAKQMTIDQNMHWYVIRFLAHKLAYENEVGKSVHPELVLMEYVHDQGNKNLQQISVETNIPLEELELYNKWILSSYIPDNKPYIVILPAKIHQQKQLAVLQEKTNTPTETVSVNSGSSDKKRKDKKEIPQADPTAIVRINGMKAVMAKSGDNYTKLAYAGGIDPDLFLKYNDMERYEPIKKGEVYYLEFKKSKALILTHTVQKGETLWDISQKNGVRLKSLMKKNRMAKKEALEVGRILYMKNKRPKGEDIRYEKQVVDKIPDKLEKTKENIEGVPSVGQKKEAVSNSEKVAEESMESEDDFEEVPTSDKTEEAQPQEKAINNKPKEQEKAKEENSLVDGKEVQYHYVYPKETLYSIAKKYQVSTENIMIWNALLDTNIKVGQKLIVNPSVKPVQIIHVAESGDTIYKISRIYGVSVTELMEWNEKTDYNISIGEKIIIKK